MVDDRRGVLVSWVHRHISSKPEVVFNDNGFKVGDKDVPCDVTPSHGAMGKMLCSSILGLRFPTQPWRGERWSSC